jgi:predicted N-acetyltransferase YhbS
LVADDSVLSLVATSAGDLVGFVIAALVPAPPVYEPGGMTCLIDDFTVKRAEDWVRVGVPLLAAVSDLARQRGAAQVVVVTAHLDQAKRNALRAGGLTIASEWWVSPPEADSAP